jgi:hypothetical protein
MLPSFSTRRFSIGLIVIIVIYSAFYLLLAENKSATFIPIYLRHIIKIVVVFLVYFSGSFFLGRLSQKWLIHVWHIIHISLISLLIILWVWHFLISPLPLNLRRLGYSIHEFLISPLLYVATGLLGRLIKEERTTSEIESRIP